MKLVLGIIGGVFLFVCVFVAGLAVWLTHTPYLARYECEHKTGQRQVDACSKAIARETAYGHPVDYAYVDRCSAYVGLRQFAHAMDDCTKAIALNPRSAPAHFNRAMVYGVMRKPDAQLQDFDAAIGLNPGFYQALHQRGMLYMRMGQPDLAIKDYNAALRIKPDDLLAIANRGIAFLSSHQYERAIGDFDTVIRVMHLDPVVLGFRAMAYAGSGRYELAMRDLDISVHTSPNAMNLNARCWTRAMWGRELDAALDDCNASLALAPNFSAALDSRAFVEFRQQKYAAAIADEDRAIAMMPNGAALLYVRGLAKRKSGGDDSGSADIAAAKKLDPKIEDTYAGYGVVQ